MVDKQGVVRSSKANVSKNYEVPHPYETVLLCGLLACSAIAAMADLHEQSFVAHGRKIAAGNTDICEILRPHFASVSCEGYSALSQ